MCYHADIPLGNKLTCTRREFQDTFEVLVGSEPDQERFTLHTDVFIPRSRYGIALETVLRRHSELMQQSYRFFKASQSERWQDGNKPADLAHASPSLFVSSLRVIYTGSFNPPDATNEPSFTQLIHTYTLADELGDLRTASFTIDYIIAYSERTDSVPLVPDIELVYQNTPPGSPLRKLMVDSCLYEMDFKKFGLDKVANAALTDFLVDVVKDAQKLVSKMYRLKRPDLAGAVPARRPRCFYHQHDAVHPKCR